MKNKTRMITNIHFITLSKMGVQEGQGQAGGSSRRVRAPTVPLRYSYYYPVLYAITRNTFQSHYGPRVSWSEGEAALGRRGAISPCRTRLDNFHHTGQTTIARSYRQDSNAWLRSRLCTVHSYLEETSLFSLESGFC